jgi:Fe-S cluster biogenesis protein NfuA
MLKKIIKRTEKIEVNKIEEKIKKIIEKLRPSLQMDGGDLNFINFDETEGLLKVEMMGRCAHCPMSLITLKQGIEREIVKAVPQVKEVRAIGLNI